MEEALSLCNEGAFLLQSNRVGDAIASLRLALAALNDLAPDGQEAGIEEHRVYLVPGERLSHFKESSFYIFDRPFFVRARPSGEQLKFEELALAAVLFNLGLCFQCKSLLEANATRKAVVFYQLCDNILAHCDPTACAAVLTVVAKNNHASQLFEQVEMTSVCEIMKDLQDMIQVQFGILDAHDLGGLMVNVMCAQHGMHTTAGAA